MNDNAGEWNVLIGVVATTFGNKGELKVWPQTDHPERFKNLDEVCVRMPDGECRVLGVGGVRFHKGAVILRLKGVDDMTAAEGLRNAEIRVRQTEIHPLAEGEYYIHDIVGLEAVTTEGESLGIVREVLRSPANDVYVTDRAMIPAVREFIVSIDLGEGKIVVRPVEGLVQE